jgi:hypothetical protein
MSFSKEEILGFSKKLNKKHPDVRFGFKAKLKTTSGEKWFVKMNNNLWIQDRYKINITYGKVIDDYI